MQTNLSSGIEILLVYVGHGCEELNHAICGIKNKGIN
jgi:hypothetical protein